MNERTVRCVVTGTIDGFPVVRETIWFTPSPSRRFVATRGTVFGVSTMHRASRRGRNSKIHRRTFLCAGAVRS